MSRRALASVLVATVATLGATQFDQSGSTSAVAVAAGCKGRTVTVVNLPRARYPNIADHAEDAIAGRTANGKRWPRILRINREDVEQRRRYAVAKLPSRPAEDRDEYPPDVGRSTLDADVRYVDDSENRGAGARMGNQIRRLPDGACFRLNFKG